MKRKEFYRLNLESHKSPQTLKKPRKLTLNEPNSNSESHERIWKSMARKFEEEPNSICDLFNRVSFREDIYKTPSQRNLFYDARKEIYLDMAPKKYKENAYISCKKTLLFSGITEENNELARYDEDSKANAIDVKIQEDDTNNDPVKNLFPVAKIKYEY